MNANAAAIGLQGARLSSECNRVYMQHVAVVAVALGRQAKTGGIGTGIRIRRDVPMTPTRYTRSPRRSALTLGVTLAAALAATSLLWPGQGLGGRVALADPPGPISFNGARSEMQSDMSISRSGSDAAAQDAYWAANEAQDALTYAKEAADAAKRCDKERFEQWKALFQSAMDQSNTEENRAQDWQGQANTAYGQAQKRLSDMEFFADAGNAAQASDIAGMSGQLDALNAHELDNLANEQSNLNLAGVLRSQAQDVIDKAQIDIDNCGDEENDVAPPDDGNGDGSQAGVPGGSGSTDQPSGDSGTQSGSSGGTNGGSQPSTPLTPPSGTANGAGATGNPGDVSHQPVLLSRSECRGGYWHVITYDVSDPNHWVQISDEQTVQPCAVPGDPTSNTTPTTNNDNIPSTGTGNGSGTGAGTGNGSGSGAGVGTGTGNGQPNMPGTTGQPTLPAVPGGTGGTQPAGTTQPALIQLSVPAGPAGLPVVLDGMGFTPGSHLTVCWQSAIGNCQQLASFTGTIVSPTGSFAGNFNVPSDTPGPHQIFVRDQSGRQATATFTLLPGGAQHAG